MGGSILLTAAVGNAIAVSLSRGTNQPNAAASRAALLPHEPDPGRLPLQGKLPGVLSMTDFVGWRFGTVAQWYFLAMALFNMAIVSLSEMTTGALRQAAAAAAASHQPAPLASLVVRCAAVGCGLRA